MWSCNVEQVQKNLKWSFDKFFKRISSRSHHFTNMQYILATHYLSDSFLKMCLLYNKWKSRKCTYFCCPILLLKGEKSQAYSLFYSDCLVYLAQLLINKLSQSFSNIHPASLLQIRNNINFLRSFVCLSLSRIQFTVNLKSNAWMCTPLSPLHLSTHWLWPCSMVNWKAGGCSCTIIFQTYRMSKHEVHSELNSCGLDIWKPWTVVFLV